MALKIEIYPYLRRKNRPLAYPIWPPFDYFGRKYRSKLIKICFNGFIGWQNMGIDTKVSFLGGIVFII